MLALQSHLDRADQTVAEYAEARRTMTTPSKTVEAPSDLTKCPVCGYRMRVLPNREDYVSLGCATCQVSLSLPKATYERLTTQRM